MLIQYMLILVQGRWIGSSSWNTILDPLNGEPFIKVADVNETEIDVRHLCPVFQSTNHLFS